MSYKKEKNNNPNLPAVYLSDWYYKKIKYPLDKKGTYFDETENYFVYVMYNQINKLYKIGITCNIKDRIRAIRTQSGCEIELVIAIQLHTGYDENSAVVEKLLHEFFNERRTFGEWFKLDVKCLIAIRNLFWDIEGEDIVDYIKPHLKSIKN